MVFRVWNQPPRITNMLIQNNYMRSGGCHSHGCGGGMGKTMGWIFGLSALSSALGGIFGGRSQQTYSDSYLPGFDYGNRNRLANPGTEKTAEQKQADTLANLNKIYSDYTWINDGGVFRAFKDGQQVASGKSFEEVIGQLQKKSTVNPQEQQNRADIQTQKEISAFNEHAKENGVKLEKTDDGKYTFKYKDANGTIHTAGPFDSITAATIKYNELYNITQAEEIEDPADNELSAEEQAKIDEFNNNEKVKAKGAKIEYVDGKYILTYTKNGKEVTEEVDNLDAALVKLGLKSPKETKGGSGRIAIPSGWERVKEEQNDGAWTPFYSQNKQYSDCKNADDIYNQLISKAKANGYKWNSPIDPAKLIEQIRNNNPSVLDRKTGDVRSDADWSKLDLPTEKWLEENGYISKDDTPKKTTKKTFAENYSAMIADIPINAWPSTQPFK